MFCCILVASAAHPITFNLATSAPHSLRRVRSFEAVSQPLFTQNILGWAEANIFAGFVFFFCTPFTATIRSLVDFIFRVSYTRVVCELTCSVINILPMN